MYFLIAGVILLALKYFEISGVAAWSWYVVFAPFALAVAWWTWADMSGYTKKKAMDKMDKRKQARIDKNRENIGLSAEKRRKR